MTPIRSRPGAIADLARERARAAAPPSRDRPRARRSRGRAAPRCRARSASRSLPRSSRPSARPAPVRTTPARGWASAPPARSGSPESGSSRRRRWRAPQPPARPPPPPPSRRSSRRSNVSASTGCGSGRRPRAPWSAAGPAPACWCVRARSARRAAGARRSSDSPGSRQPAFLSARMPQWTGSPARCAPRSLSSIGTPRNGPAGRSEAAAWARARSNWRVITEPSSGSSLSMRAIAASTSSSGFTSPRRTSSAWAVASSSERESAIAPMLRLGRRPALSSRSRR